MQLDFYIVWIEGVQVHALNIIFLVFFLPTHHLIGIPPAGVYQHTNRITMENLWQKNKNKICSTNYQYKISIELLIRIQNNSVYATQ